ncbi:histidinol phosphate aminotransferase [Tamilnaduibacter salinus]|uniref:Histidinol-phosphate aminotransferase n=1 Tax=Tamilnaduibacter salinus TaxID=1484056 RepID=A0A2A2I2G1_9GAMM|nr:histidinol-phosphate transaminase [Tamilnaduibacter salinus]PAV25325.1 histidinol-phosphate transaminase [Tamilnaduibacter salinus]PVY70775.1 histidinol phosphate aminotransferase [Tamilnaduibacter salinus]
MSRYWSPFVHNLVPYVPGEQPKMPDLVKLNTNENPYGPSPRVNEAIAGQLGDGLRLYPDPSSDALKGTIARYHGVRSNHVFVGNGSDEVLAHIFQGLFGHGKPLLFPDVTYSFYPVYCGLYGIEPKPVPLDDDFRIHPDMFQGECSGIIFPNPNAPTGRLLPLSDIETILKAHPDVVVVVDEAYVDFGGETAIGLVDQYSNLLVTQTLSKSRSLAGLRVGFAVGHPDLIEALERIKNSFNSYPIDRLALAGAIAAYEDEEHFQSTRKAVMAERSRVTEGLEALGFRVLPSSANFVFTEHPDHEGADIAGHLREHGIIVRHFNKPRIGNFLRITIGNPEQNGRLLATLGDILKRFDREYR